MTDPRDEHKPSLDAPMFHLMFREAPCLKPILSTFYWVRSRVMLPMQIRVVPRALAVHLPIWIAFITVGQLLSTVPLLVFFLKGYHYTFVNPNLDLNGKEATNALYWAFLTANKSNSVFSFLLGIPFERMIPLHRLSALLAVTIGCFHTYVAFRYGGDGDGDSDHADFGQDPNLLLFLFDGPTNNSGLLALGSIAILVTVSAFSIPRRYLFNAWYTLHIVLGAAVLVGIFWHTSTDTAVFVTSWWALDLITRYVIMAAWQYQAKATLRKIGHGAEDGRDCSEPAVEILFDKPENFDYNAGQFVQVAIPKLGLFEFHPISISSAPHESRVSLHVRALGDWTKRLVELAETIDTTDILIEGPYGASSADIENEKRYPIVLIVSGGIGVTPCQSIGKSLLHQHEKYGRNLKSMRFIWVVRNTRIVDDIPPLGGGQDFSSPTIAGEKDYADGIVEATESTMNLDPSCSSALHHGPRKPVIQIDVHCTRSPENGTDVLKSDGLLYNLHSGRPDLDKIFKELKQNALDEGETNVAVIGCGPRSLMRTLHKCCLKYSAPIVGCERGVFFDLHTETFEL